MFSFIKNLLVLLRNTISLLCKETVTRLTQTQPKSLQGEVILVTGGGRGIGKQIALQFAIHKPAHIILWGRTATCLEETVHAVRRLGVNCSYMLCDVGDREHIYSCGQELKAKFGEVSILVNNAGIVAGNSVVDARVDDVEETFNVNTFAHIWTVKFFLPDMVKNNHGHIVFVNSVLGLFGLKGAGSYVSSKFASTGLAESVRQELEDTGKNIRVTSIHPYQVDNDMFAGMHTKLSAFLAPLSESYVAERTVEAVLYNRNQVLLPRIMYLLYFFNSVMPVSVSVIINKALGVDRAMEKVTSKSLHPNVLKTTPTTET